MICGFLESAMDCPTISMPPIITAVRTPIPEPRDSKDSEIWNANSLTTSTRYAMITHAVPAVSFTYRVGARTTAKHGDGFCHNACRIGMANAAVLPDPVCA